MAKPMLTILPGWDMYEFHLAAVAALRKAALLDQARELHQRRLDAPSFYHMRELVQEYVTLDVPPANHLTIDSILNS
jgi:hypothetical protein